MAGAVSQQQFIVDIERFVSLMPLGQWRSHPEHIWTVALQTRPDAAFFVYMDKNSAGVTSCSSVVDAESADFDKTTAPGCQSDSLDSLVEDVKAGSASMNQGVIGKD